MGEWLVHQILQQFAAMVLDPLPHLLILVRDLVLRVPDVTGQQPVIDLAGRSLRVVEVSYVLVVMVAGIVAMTHGGVQSEYSAKDLLQRAVLGFVAAHFGLWIIRVLTRATNAVILALVPTGGGSLRDLDSSDAMATQLEKAPESLLVLLVVQVVIVALLVVLLIGWLVRFVRLALMAGLAPLALACYGLPWLEPVVSFWWWSLVGILVTVLAQAAALQFGLQMLLDPGSDLSGIGTFDHSDALTSMLLILCLLIAVMRIPATVSRFVPAGGGRSGGAGPVGMVLRYTLLNRTLRRGASAQSPGRVMTLLAGRFARRQAMRSGLLAGLQSPAPTWTGIGQGVGNRLRSVRPATLANWPVAVAVTGAPPHGRGAGQWSPLQQQLTGMRRDWVQRRARLAGRSVRDPDQQPLRVAGRRPGEQQARAATLIQQRRSRAATKGGTVGGTAALAAPGRGAAPSGPGAGAGAGGERHRSARIRPSAAGRVNRGRTAGNGPRQTAWPAGQRVAGGRLDAARIVQPVTRRARAQAPDLAARSVRTFEGTRATPSAPPRRPVPSHHRFRPSSQPPPRPARPNPPRSR